MEEKRTAVVDALGRWIAQEMKYSPQGKFAHCAPPSANDLRALCRGVSLPLWDYIVHRVRSEKTVENIKKNLEVARSRREQEGEAIKRAERLDKLKARKQALQTQMSDTRAAIGKLHVQSRATHLEIAATERDQALVQRKIEEHDSKVVILEAYEKQISRLHSTLNDYQKRLETRLNQMLPHQMPQETTKKDATVQSTESKRISEVYEAICTHMENTSSNNNVNKKSDNFGLATALPTEIEAKLAEICASPNALRTLISHLALISKIETEQLERSTEKLDLSTLEQAALERLEKDTLGQASHVDNELEFPSSTSSSSNTTTTASKSNGNPSLFPTVEELLEQQRQEHVSRFLAAEKALNTAHTLRKQRDEMLETSGRSTAYLRDSSEISKSSENLDPNAVVVVPTGGGKADLFERLQNMELALSAEEAAYEKSCEIVERLKETKKRFEKDLRVLKDKFARIQELDRENKERQGYCQELLRANGVSRKVFEAQTNALIAFISSNFAMPSSNTSPTSSRASASTGEDLSGALMSRELSTFFQLRSASTSPTVSTSMTSTSTGESQGEKDDIVASSVSRLVDALDLKAHQSVEDLVSIVFKSVMEVERAKTKQERRKKELEEAISTFAQWNDDAAIKSIEEKAVAVEKTHEEVLRPILEENIAQVAKATEHCAAIQQLYKDFVEQPAQHFAPWLKIDGQDYGAMLKTWKMLYHELRQQRQSETK